MYVLRNQGKNFHLSIQLRDKQFLAQTTKLLKHSFYWISQSYGVFSFRFERSW